MHFDVFNGDADGIIALVQLRLAEPKESTLITGVKRDISLLKQVDVNAAETITVLDISLEKNVEALKLHLENNTEVFYIDHHRAGDIPHSEHLTTLINTDANTCTSLLVNDYLKGAYVHWAVAAAFGDNMTQSAITLAESVGLSEGQQEQLKALGIYINYNGYGRDVDDLHFHPAELYQVLLAYPDPLTLIEEEGSIFHQLEKAYQADMQKALTAKILADSEISKVVQLEDAPWARRVSGVFGNDLANQSPDKAHAVITLNADNTYTVSVRAPLNNKQGADEVCIQFPTGGGRAGAAGINLLPETMLPKFIDTLNKYYKA
ncbi:acetyltransferase [Colwellia sp. UCD-KL20]|uniref:acetyltransferase n=1 Tax=Colwellia sp. UCD-KL20 TaxID=1917165 RepID=UPI0009708852|nr:acetyltransferase [Colwellia sp. UCD-KL20]